MAPALVEHSNNKERNSVTNNYLNFNCMSHLEIDLVAGKLAHTIDSPSVLYTPSFKRKINNNSNIGMLPNDTENKHSKYEFAKQTTENGVLATNCDNVTNMKIQNEITCFKNNKNQNHVIANLPINVITTFSNHISPVSSKALPSSSISANTTTDEQREAQPIAKYVPTKNLSIMLDEKYFKVNKKIDDINCAMNRLSMRLFDLQNSSLKSHSSCFIAKKDQLQNECNTKKDALGNSKVTDVLTNKDRHSNIASSKNLSTKANSYLSLKKLYDLTKNNDTTDDDDDIESKARIPLRGKRQKCDHPTPQPSVLHHWKQKRAKVGSQCSWLMLKISELDEKLAILDKSHTCMKANRQTLFQEELTNRKNSLDEKHAITNQLINNELESSDGANSLHVCSRTRPFLGKPRHHYVYQIESHVSSTSAYGCRCVRKFNSCRLCHKSLDLKKDFSKNIAEKCDESYHAVLSNENDISLSFLLEETLRKQKINTKVTITKSTKKKKKNISASSSTNISPIESKLIKQSAAKNKSERSKSDEYSRKRYAASDISSKLKKFRKLSESHSCDSGSKPSTPTNELSSPLLSQSLSSLSSLKRKKAASTVDYDINNIVIPYSIASSTRVERIQYKEIPTPGWRNIDDNLNNGDSESEHELTDDESINERHLRCEILEKRKFTACFQPVRRQRSTRNSEGPNSEPPSPAFTEDTRSMVNTPVDSPTSSAVNHWNRSINITPCVDEERELPWTLRRFPLEEIETKKLEEVSEPASPLCDKLLSSKSSLLTRSPSLSHVSSSSPRNSPLPSPLISPVTPDVNWTVKLVNNGQSGFGSGPASPAVSSVERQRKGIVLKLAKK